MPHAHPNRASFRAVVDADLAQTGSARLGIFAEQHALPAPVRFAADHAFAEHLQNLVDHSKARQVEYEFAIDDQRLALTVVDDGVPFDLLSLAAPDVTIPIEDRPVGGLGIHMIRKLMDDVQYQRSGGRNRVAMIKSLSPQTARP